MAVTIEVKGIEATINNYKWRCDDRVMRRLFNSMLDPMGPSGADPDPDRTAAEAVIEAFGGKIVEADEQPFDAGVIY